MGENLSPILFKLEDAEEYLSFMMPYIPKEKNKYLQDLEAEINKGGSNISQIISKFNLLNGICSNNEKYKHNSIIQHYIEELKQKCQ